MSEFIPYGKIYEIQITEKELYAFEPLLCDAIHSHTEEIADLRKKLGIPSEYPDTVGMLANIQSLEGKITILKNILSQMGMDYQ
jgi:hypothetical protein